MQPTFSSAEKKLLIISVLCILGILALETLFWGSRGFFYDEAWVANSINEPRIEKMLFYEKVAQNTPVGMLLLLRGLVAIFGDQEWVYRLPALGATLLCIPILILLGKQLVLSSQTIRYAVLLFTLHPLVLQYSQEAKQYPFDMLSILGIFSLYLAYQHKPTSERSTWFIGGSIFSFFFSYVTPFALGGIACKETYTWYRTKKFPTLPVTQLIMSTLSIGIIYLTAYHPNHTSALHYLWILNGGFPTYTSWYEPLGFIIKSFYRLAGSFSHTFVGPVLLPLIILGIYRLGKNACYNQYVLGVCATMIGTVLIGAYPFSQNVMNIRVQLFLLPLLCIYVGEALASGERNIKHPTLFFWCVLIGMCGITAYALSIPTYGRTNDMSYVFNEYLKNYEGEETLIASALRPEFEHYISDPKKTKNVSLMISRSAKEYGPWIDDYIRNHTNSSFWFIPSPASAEPRTAVNKFKANCTIIYEYHHLKSELYYIRC